MAVRVTDELELWPSQINLGRLPRNPAKGRPVKWHLTLTNHRERVFRIQELQYNKDYFEVKAMPLGQYSATRYRIKVTPPARHLPLGKTAETLIITTDWANAKAFKVPRTILLLEE